MVTCHDEGICGLEPWKIVHYTSIIARCSGASNGYLSVMANSHDVTFCTGRAGVVACPGISD